MNIIEAIILAIIEGLTEFLPVSSTGHMIIGSTMMGLQESPFVKMFTVAIQFGAILSVVFLYRRRFFKSFDFYFKLFVAFLPAAVFGYIFNDYIDKMLESVIIVAFMLVIGGVVLVCIDDWFKAGDIDFDVNYKEAFIIGLFQVIAMIPGVSRSAATIIGGLTQKLTRKAAAEFSFFLAVPTMFAATIYKMYQYHTEYGIKNTDLDVLFIGNLVAFIVAFFAIKSFVNYVTEHGFKVFGYYRIAVGVIILVLYFMGYDLKVV
ncbi:MAG TPA: undecaprenyl-diphosphate phosphatase [Sphingobacteriaceae bacterium]|nr:undecaprenyl-diphosphate phosphatase [Sphingobacteriaceae bacterium]